MGSSTSPMVQRLKEFYPDWGIDIEPPPAGPRSGVLRQPNGSGLVRYTFSENEKGAFLEYYSFHRIWGDSHLRLYASGEVEHLDTLASTIVLTGDPDKDKQQRERLHERNRRLLEELEEAGLLSGGPIPGSFEINAAILTGAVDPDDPRPDSDP